MEGMGSPSLLLRCGVWGGLCPALPFPASSQSLRGHLARSLSCLSKWSPSICGGATSAPRRLGPPKAGPGRARAPLPGALHLLPEAPAELTSEGPGPQRASRRPPPRPPFCTQWGRSAFDPELWVSPAR